MNKIILYILATILGGLGLGLLGGYSYASEVVRDYPAINPSSSGDVSFLGRTESSPISVYQSLGGGWSGSYSIHPSVYMNSNYWNSPPSLPNSQNDGSPVGSINIRVCPANNLDKDVCILHGANSQGPLTESMYYYAGSGAGSSLYRTQSSSRPWPSYSVVTSGNYLFLEIRYRPGGGASALIYRSSFPLSSSLGGDGGLAFKLVIDSSDPIPSPPVPIASQIPGPPTLQCQQYWRAESNMAYYIDTCFDETIQTNTGYQYVFDIYGMKSVDAGTITGTLEELNVEYNNYACAAAVVLARTTKDIYSSGTYNLLIERAWNRAQGPINDYLGSESQAYGEVRCRDNGDTVGDIIIGSGYLTDLLQYDYGSGYNFSSSALIIGGMKNCLRGFGFNMLRKIGDPPVNIQQESQSPIGVVNCVLLALTPNLSDTGEYPFSDVIPSPPACMVVEGGSSTVSLLIFRSCIMGLTFPFVRYLVLPSKNN